MKSIQPLKKIALLLKLNDAAEIINLRHLKRQIFKIVVGRR